jgi:2-aminoadipate transaminase
MSQDTLSAPSQTIWETHWSAAAGAISGSAIRELLKVTEQPGMISFAGGLPAPECFPAEEIAVAAERVLAREAARVLQYGPTEGFPPLRQFLTELMRGRGLPITADQLLITNGSQQGLDMIGRLLIDPGDPVLVENPTYVGALQAFRPYRPRFVTLPMDDQGLRIEGVEQALSDLAAAGQRPKFLYTVASFQNPTGVTLSAERRHALIELAARYDVPIVEDDPYGELRYSGEAPPPLAAIDIARSGAPRQVLYLSTFSKLLAPGLRIGWAVGPEALMRRMVQLKQGLDLHTGSLGQAIAYESCHDGLLTRQILKIRAIYHERRDAMLSTLDRYMPAGTRWTRPDGGMFLWITLPEHFNTTELLPHALDKLVAFVPGGAFHANGGGENTMRLNFSFSSPATIVDGVQRLAQVFKEVLG